MSEVPHIIWSTGARSRIETFAIQYLRMSPNYQHMTQDRAQRILFEFMEKVYRDCSENSLAPPPVFAHHDPAATAVEAGFFSHHHPDEEMRGKRARLGVLAFDLQRYKISWAWMNDHGTYQPAQYVELSPWLDLQKARMAAAQAYDAAEHEAVRRHNMEVLVHLARRELLVDMKRLPPGQYGTPFVGPLFVSWMLT